MSLVNECSRKMFNMKSKISLTIAKIICESDMLSRGDFVRGISRGERMRVCIGHEILIDPSPNQQEEEIRYS